MTNNGYKHLSTIGKWECFTDAISKIDESKASLRLLIVLDDFEEGIIQQTLRTEMKARYKVGRGAVDSAVKVCVELGLVVLSEGDEKPMPSIIHRLTNEGREIADLCQSMVARLDDWR